MLLSVVLASCGGTPPPEPLSPSRPDLILIVIDALRRDHVGFHGQPAPTTPQLDRLAASGVVFDNAYAHAPQTFNSTAALLTSRYFPWLAEQQETGLAGAPPENRYFALASANRTLAEALKDAGYQTMAVLTNPHHWAGSGFWQGFEHPIYLTADSRAAAYARADRVHAAFLDWFDRALQPGPYFAYLHFMDVHNPYRAPRAIQRQFVTARGEDRYTNGLPREDAVPSAEDLVFMRQMYQAEIHFVDAVIGGLIEALGERDSQRNVVVVVTSDHGDEFMDHGGLGHGMTLEKEMLHIPLLLHGLAPRRIPQLVRHLDIAPTFLELAGATADREFEGLSLVPMIKDPRKVGSRSSLAWMWNMKSLTTERWHFIRYADGLRLYDNRNDPAGVENLAPQHGEAVERLQRGLVELDRQQAQSIELGRWLETSADHRVVDPEIVEQLRALGYLQ